MQLFFSFFFDSIKSKGINMDVGNTNMLHNNIIIIDR